MMSVALLYKTKEYATDKNSIHSYIDQLYDKLFSPLKDSVSNVLEIGVYDGGSILLWRDYFVNATITAIDINDCSSKLDNDRINHVVANAYNQDLLQSLPKFDIIIDDGPHTLDSMIFFVQNYLQLLTDTGIAVIEDVQDYRWFDILTSFIPSDEYSYEVVDLRSVKGRYDDMMLIIKKLPKD
jgi:hypothetical protein